MLRAAVAGPGTQPEAAPNTLVPMTDQDGIAELVKFAQSYSSSAVAIKQALVSLDENQDGDPVTRVALLLTEPHGDTWEVDDIIEMRQALRRRATELSLPPVTLTLVAESERDAIDAFAQ